MSIDESHGNIFRNLSVVKIYIIRPKPGSVAKNTTPRASQSEGLGVAFFATGPSLGLIMYILTTLGFPKHYFNHDLPVQYMVTRLWWLSCLSNSFQPLRIQTLYQRSDRITKEFVNTLPKIMQLPLNISAGKYLQSPFSTWGSDSDVT